MKSKELHMIAFTLVIVGAINWGLVALIKFNLVTMLFGFMPVLETLVYVLVGLSGVYLIATHKNDCKTCSEMMKKDSK